MKKEKKYWVRRDTLELTLIWLICLVFVLIPMIAFWVAILCNQDDISYALVFASKLSAIFDAVALVLCGLRLYFCSEYIIFTDEAFKCYRYLFSKQCKEIPLEFVSECVISGGLWERQSQHVRGRKIFLFYRGKKLKEFEPYGVLMLEFLLRCGNRTRVVGDTYHLQKIEKYYNIDFWQLRKDQQLALTKYYCKTVHNNLRDGEKILRKYKLWDEAE
ncbi:MAG: hypothetical protein K2J30_04215 [Clostridia bacterium]|nr:hypothetical protein [Clostridia bacterium]